MIRLILLAVLFFLGYTAVKALLRPLNKKPNPAVRSRQGETMVQDPQCGAYVPVNDALSTTVAGKQHYFCSKKCRNLYRAGHK
ncbi:MAG TPA: hypothetical protein VGA63_00075 [Geopsychrobacteraceae bacterium]|jgi:YHS domain-containing protein